MFDKIVVTITQLEGGVYLVSAQGSVRRDENPANDEITELGSRRCNTKSAVIDFFVQKVEEQ